MSPGKRPWWSELRFHLLDCPLGQVPASQGQSPLLTWSLYACLYACVWNRLMGPSEAMGWARRQWPDSGAMTGPTVGAPRVSGWTPAVVLRSMSPHGKCGGTELGNSLICVHLQLPPPLLGKNSDGRDPWDHDSHPARSEWLSSQPTGPEGPAGDPGPEGLQVSAVWPACTPPCQEVLPNFGVGMLGPLSHTEPQGPPADLGS